MIFEFNKVTNMGEEPVRYLSSANCWIKFFTDKFINVPVIRDQKSS